MKPASGGAPLELYRTEDVRQLLPAWSPRGDEVAFAVEGDLMVVPSGGGKPVVLASVERWEPSSPAWSPRGQSLASFARLEGETQNTLLVVDRASKAVTRLTPASESFYKEMLSWHPDGDRISYMYYGTEDSNGSRVVALESGRISDLANMPDPMWDYVGIWAPDKRFYFLSVPRGPQNLWGLYRLDVESKQYQPVRRPTGRSVSLPSWSRDGTRMVWSETEPLRQLWMLTNYEP